MSNVLHFPDVSGYDTGINFGNSYIVIAKATESTDYTNPDYAGFKEQAETHNVYFMAYHFLHAGNGKAQAEHYCSVVNAATPGMVDIEPIGDSRPSVQDAVDFITECKAQGRAVHLSYFPHWYWQDLGSPSLAALADLNQWLHTSDYTTYSDDGPGWDGYGGLHVAVWQYADNVNYGGIAEVDFNAFKGSGDNLSFAELMTQFRDIVTGVTHN